MFGFYFQCVSEKLCGQFEINLCHTQNVENVQIFPLICFMYMQFKSKRWIVEWNGNGACVDVDAGFRVGVTGFCNYVTFSKLSCCMSNLLLRLLHNSTILPVCNSYLSLLIHWIKRWCGHTNIHISYIHTFIHPFNLNVFVYEWKIHASLHSAHCTNSEHTLIQTLKCGFVVVANMNK